MYQISRALYRSLVDEVTVEDRPGHSEIRRKLLEACEATVHRLITDRFYFAHPARTLFREIRWCFPVAAQPRVYSIIDEQLNGVAERFAQDPELVFALTGHRMSCRAWARKGRPCERQPAATDTARRTGISPTTSSEPTNALAALTPARP
jgi:hypothetical protein